jgi:hypothetical protein
MVQCGSIILELWLRIWESNLLWILQCNTFLNCRLMKLHFEHSGHEETKAVICECGKLYPCGTAGAYYFHRLLFIILLLGCAGKNYLSVETILKISRYRPILCCFSLNLNIIEAGHVHSDYIPRQRGLHANKTGCWPRNSLQSRRERTTGGPYCTRLAF